MSFFRMTRCSWTLFGYWAGPVYGLGWSGGMVQKFASGMNHTSQIFSSWMDQK
jgi:hypothetical protein